MNKLTRFRVLLLITIVAMLFGCTDQNKNTISKEETTIVQPEEIIEPEVTIASSLSEEKIREYIDKAYSIWFDAAHNGKVVRFTPLNDEVDYCIVTTDNNTYYVFSDTYYGLRYKRVMLKNNDVNTNINRMLVQGYTYDGELVNECTYTNIMFYDVGSKTDLSGLLEISQETEYLYISESSQFGKEVSISHIIEMKNLKVLNTRSIDAINISCLSELPNLVSLRLDTKEEKIPVMSELRVLEIGYQNNSDDVLILGGLTDLSALLEMEKLENLYLKINCVEDLDDLANLNNLKKLTFDYCTQLKNVNGISNLQNLEEIYLWIRACEVDINGLSKIESLKKLHISGSSVFYPTLKDWDKLGEITQLETLRITADETKLDFLPNLVNLKNLTLYGEYDNIDGLYGMESIEILRLSGEFLNVDAIGSLTNLKELELGFGSIDGIGRPWLDDRLNGEVSIEEIQNLTQLERLEIGTISYLESFEPIAKLNSLKELSLCDFYIDDAVDDISFLKELEGLESLDIVLKDVNELSIIWGLTNLKKLEITNGAGEYDFSSLKNLEQLTMYNTNIVNFNSIETLENLKMVFIDEAPNLDDISGILNLDNIKCLYLNNVNSAVYIGLENKKETIINKDGYYIFE